MAAGDLWHLDEKPLVKEVLGFATYILTMSLLGVFLILIADFPEILSLASLASVSFVLSAVSAFKSSARVSTSHRALVSREERNKKSLFLVFLYVSFTLVLFYALWLARTGEGETSVWLTIPEYFLPTFFLTSLFLTLILFFTRVKTCLKLGLLSVHSFLSHSLFLLVWYPGRYGDPWAHLAQARYINTYGMPFAYDWLIQKFLIIDIVKYKTQYALVVFFGRMLSLDVYWIQIVLIPLLWSLFVPFCSYKIAALLAVKKTSTFPLLAATCAGLFSWLIYWGAVSVPNSLGFILFLISMVLLFSWVDSGKRSFWFLSVAGAIVTFFAHPLTGIFTAVFVLGASIVVQRRLPIAAKLASYLMVFLSYPLVLYLGKATFSFLDLVNLENILVFFSQIPTLLLVFGFLGLVYGVGTGFAKSKIAGLMFLFYLTLQAGYYFTAYGMRNSPITPERIVGMEELLLLPLVALGLLATVSGLKIVLLAIKGKNLVKRNPRSVGMLLVCLFLSFQTSLTLYDAYPRNEITAVQPAWYEIDATYYIDSTTDRYVVLCEPSFANLAVGLLGPQYSYGSDVRGAFGVPEWYWWSIKLYEQMSSGPSVNIFEDAMSITNATVGYFVVSVRNPFFNDIVERMSVTFPVDKVFGDGKLYVFRYPFRPLPVVEGVGPNITVIYDNGVSTQKVPSRYKYTNRNEVTYKLLPLSGHSSYNISDYPSNWTFLTLLVNNASTQFDESSDLNKFLFIQGLGYNDVLEATWRANDLYPVVGWKEDSFRSGWRGHSLYTGTITPDVSTDGNVLSLSWSFIPETYQYYYYVKRLNVSTSVFPFIIVRWKSSGPVAVVAVAYASDEKLQYPIVGFGSQSDYWIDTIGKLEPNETTAYVMIGITNLSNRETTGLQTVYVDYVLIAAQEEA
jgi:hypothetical protein